MADTSVVPPSGGAAYNTNPDEFSPWSWITTPKGILRLCEWLFSIIMFATMADVNQFHRESEYRYEVACGVLVWLYVTAVMLVYVCRKSVERHCLYLPVIELAFDGIFSVMLLAAGASTASRCNADINMGLGGTVSWCADSPTTTINKLKASIVFAFFTFICMCVSTYFSYRDNAAEEAKK